MCFNATMTTRAYAPLTKALTMRRVPGAPKQSQIRCNVTTTHGAKVQASELNLDKGQDVVHGGEIPEGPYMGHAWALACDGHGPSSAIPNWTRDLPPTTLHTMFSTTDPILKLEELIAQEFPKGVRRSGMCVVAARVSPTGKIELWNVGDSRGQVYIDGKVVLTTNDHTANNKDEIERLMRERGLKWEEGNLYSCALREDLLCTDEGTLKVLPPREGEVSRPLGTLGDSYRINFSEDEDEFQMTRAVGHAPIGLTGTNVDYYVVFAKPGQTVNVVVASDGLWDVKPDDNTLLNWARNGAECVTYNTAKRWDGTWDYEHPWLCKCIQCLHRRQAFLRGEIDHITRSSSDRKNIAKVQYEYLTVLGELRRTYKSIDMDSVREDETTDEMEQIRVLMKRNDPDRTYLYTQKKFTAPKTEYNGMPIYSVQEGVKADDIGVATISWKIPNVIHVDKDPVHGIDLSMCSPLVRAPSVYTDGPEECLE